MLCLFNSYILISISDTPSAPTSDLRLLLNDLHNDKHQKHPSKKYNDTFNVDNPKDSSDIEDDLAMILNDRKERSKQKPIEPQSEPEQSK